MDSEVFEGNEFVIQLLAKGSFIDNGTGDGHSYLIEAYTLRLNHVALNAWIMSGTLNCRECYEDGPAGDAEWEAHKAKYAERRKVLKVQITEALGIGEDDGSFSITQAQAEIFTVVHITKVAK